MSYDDSVFPHWIPEVSAAIDDGAFPVWEGEGALGGAAIVLTPASLSFDATITRNDPAIQTVEITNGSIGTLVDVTVSGDAAWLVTWIGGVGNSQRIMNRVDIEGLDLGTYTATVTVTCGNATNSPQTYTVTLTIGVHAEPTVLEPSIIIWVAPWGDDNPGTGSQTDPYLTIERALQDFVDGSQIRLLNGTYTPTDTVMISGLTGSIFAIQTDLLCTECI